jgi:hypothetical protein
VLAVPVVCEVSLALLVVPLSLVLAVAPLPPPCEDAMLPLLPLLPVLAVSLVPVELHPASAIASRPANSTLCSLRFMINSFGWVFSVRA